MYVNKKINFKYNQIYINLHGYACAVRVVNNKYNHQGDFNFKCKQFRSLALIYLGKECVYIFPILVLGKY